MFACPPWMRTSSGYLRAGSKRGGRATKLCTSRPLSLVNENSWSGAQSSFAAASALKVVKGDGRPVAASTRTISAGRVAVPQLATITGGFAAVPATSMAPYAPLASPTGVTVPPFAGTVKSRTNPRSSAVRNTRPSGANAKSDTDRSKDAVRGVAAPVQGQAAQATRSSA